jgi:hypothetical protein
MKVQKQVFRLLTIGLTLSSVLVSKSTLAAKCEGAFYQPSGKTLVSAAKGLGWEGYIFPHKGKSVPVIWADNRKGEWEPFRKRFYDSWSTVGFFWAEGDYHSKIRIGPYLVDLTASYVVRKGERVTLPEIRFMNADMTRSKEKHRIEALIKTTPAEAKLIMQFMFYRAVMHESQWQYIDAAARGKKSGATPPENPWNRSYRGTLAGATIEQSLMTLENCNTAPASAWFPHFLNNRPSPEQMKVIHAAAVHRARGAHSDDGSHHGTRFKPFTLPYSTPAAFFIALKKFQNSHPMTRLPYSPAALMLTAMEDPGFMGFVHFNGYAAEGNFIKSDSPTFAPMAKEKAGDAVDTAKRARVDIYN